MDEETKNAEIPKDIFQNNHLKTRIYLSRPLDLDNLKMEALDCHKCQLGQSRTHVVFGIETKKVDLMFVGEAPGAEEDRKVNPSLVGLANC